MGQIERQDALVSKASADPRWSQLMVEHTKSRGTYLMLDGVSLFRQACEEKNLCFIQEHILFAARLNA